MEKSNPIFWIVAAFIIGIVVIGLLLIAAVSAAFVGKDSNSCNVTGGGSSSIETVDSIDGATIPYPNTRIGVERHLVAGLTGPHYNGPDSKPLDEEPGGGAYQPYTPEEERWFFNEAWPNAKASHKKVLITSKKTGKSVVAIVLEYGPAGWVTQQRGVGAGGSPELLRALGADIGNGETENNRIDVAFVKDQANTPLGPTDGSGGSSNASCAPSADSGGDIADFIKKISFHDSRRITPTALVLHFTADKDPSAEATIRDLKSNKECGAQGCGVQLTIDGQGKIYQLVDPLNTKMPHALGVNDKAIGIEIGGANEQQLLANEQQFQGVVKAVVAILKKYNIPLDGDAKNKRGLLSHQDVGNAFGYPGQRDDPGETYMKKVRDAVRGQL